MIRVCKRMLVAQGCSCAIMPRCNNSTATEISQCLLPLLPQAEKVVLSKQVAQLQSQLCALRSFFRDVLKRQREQIEELQCMEEVGGSQCTGCAAAEIASQMGLWCAAEEGGC
jgi:hypothetical protein